MTHIPAPGMLESIEIVTAGLQNINGLMTNEEYKKVIEDNLTDCETEMIIVSALASVTYSNIAIIEKTTGITWVEYLNNLDTFAQENKNNVPMYVNDAIGVVVARTSTFQNLIEIDEYTRQINSYLEGKDTRLFVLAMSEVALWSFQAASQSIGTTLENYIQFIATVLV